MNQSDAPGSKAGDLVSLSDEKKVIEVVSASILNLWEAVSNLTSVEAHRARAVSCDHASGPARVPKDHWVYLAVRDLSAELTRLGCDIVTGGGPGLMRRPTRSPPCRS